MPNNIYKCNRTGKVFDKKQSLINHLRNVYRGIKFSEIYCIEHNTNPNECKYCGDSTKFVNIFCGFKTYCENPECRKKYITEVNRKNAKKLCSGIDGYDNIILDNKELFISLNGVNSIIDPYDGYEHKSMRFVTLRSETSLKGDYFYSTKKCLYCNTDIKYHIIKEPNKTFCCKLCANYYKNIDVDCQENLNKIEYIRKLTLSEFSKLVSENKIRSFPKILKPTEIEKKIIFNSYNIVGETFYDEKSKIYCNIILSKGFKYNITLKMLSKEGFIDIDNYLDLYHNCSVCGKTYKLNCSFIVDNDHKLKVYKRFDSIYKYCSSKCYIELLKSGNKNNRYEYSDETKQKQSITLKEKILKGEFTPNNTNSYCFGRINYKNYKFRSTFELMFYFCVKDKYTTVEFETIRIPYFCSKANKERIYIIDFILDNNLLIEVKPESERDNSADKISALEIYAKQNNYQFDICGEKFFKENLNDSIFEEMLSDNLIEDNVKIRLNNYRKIYL